MPLSRRFRANRLSTMIDSHKRAAVTTFVVAVAEREIACLDPRYKPTYATTAVVRIKVVDNHEQESAHVTI